MTNSTSKHANMNCPSCGSYSTQSISLAYSQSVRIGETGHETVSRFGQNIAPPPPKDEKFIPIVIVTTTMGLALFALPSLLEKTGIAALTGLSSFSWPVFVLSCLIAWTFGLLFAAPAISYNLTKFPSLLKDWEEQVICRRCGHQWQSASPVEKRIKGDGECR